MFLSFFGRYCTHGAIFFESQSDTVPMFVAFPLRQPQAEPRCVSLRIIEAHPLSVTKTRIWLVPRSFGPKNGHGVKGLHSGPWTLEQHVQSMPNLPAQGGLSKKPGQSNGANSRSVRFNQKPVLCVCVCPGALALSCVCVCLSG